MVLLFRKIRKRYVKAVPEVLGDEKLSCLEVKMPRTFGGKFSSKKERPQGPKNMRPWSARDPMGTELPQPFLATWKKT